MACVVVPAATLTLSGSGKKQLRHAAPAQATMRHNVVTTGRSARWKLFDNHRPVRVRESCHIVRIASQDHTSSTLDGDGYDVCIGQIL
jgi:hypothetical protein